MFESLCTKQTMLTLQCFMCLLTLNTALMDGIQSCLSEKHRIVELLIEIPHACSCLSRCVVTIKRSVFEKTEILKSDNNNSYVFKQVQHHILTKYKAF